MGSAGFKAAVLLLIVLALVATIVVRFVELPFLDSGTVSGIEDGAGFATSAPDLPVPTVDLQTEIVAQAPQIAAPSVDSAIISNEFAQELITWGGNADEQCTVIIMLNGTEVARTQPLAGGSWNATTDAPTVGEHEVQVQCLLADNQLVLSPIIPLIIPERNVATETPPATATTEATVTAAVAVEPTTPAEAYPAATEPPQATATEEPATATLEPTATPTNVPATATATVAPTATPEPEPTATTAPAATADSNVSSVQNVRIANELDKWVGGTLLIRGSGEPGKMVNVHFDGRNSEQDVNAMVADDGEWALYGILTEPGAYQIVANGVEVGTVTVPDDLIFGSRGNCRGRTPPFGELKGDTYTVADCEYFSLIAQRLGMSFSELLSVNGQLGNLDVIEAGDILNVPPLP